jgi:hypothetical protein
MLQSSNDVLLTGNVIHDNGSTGLQLSEVSGLVEGNQVYGNRGGGIGASLSGSLLLQINGNLVHDNGGSGISASNTRVRVNDNQVWGQKASTNSAGITLTSSSQAQGNVVWGSGVGIDASFTSLALDNVVYGNLTSGINTFLSEVRGNRIYGNPIGINDTGQSRVVNNLVYDNDQTGIAITGSHSSAERGIFINTVVQVSGDAVRVSGANEVHLRDNILQVAAGNAINVASNSQVGFASDYNLFSLSGSGRVGFWEDRPFEDRADWFLELGFDQHSLTADPQFVDADGADNLLGFNAAASAAALIIDDGDAGFAQQGAWAVRTGGLGNDHREIPVGNGSNFVTWTFTGLATGYYQVAGTWPVVFPAAEVVYTMYDGADVVGHERTTQSTANDFTDAGVGWRNLDLVYVDSGTLTVRLSDQASQKVEADAIRIQRIGGDSGADDNFHLQVGSAASPIPTAGASTWAPTATRRRPPPARAS